MENIKKVNQARPRDHRPTWKLSTALCCSNSVQLDPSSQTSLSIVCVCHGQIQAFMAIVHLNYIIYDIHDCVDALKTQFFFVVGFAMTRTCSLSWY